MAGALAKATAFAEPGVTETRDWLIQNIKVEERHLQWYRDWAKGFGLTVEQLDSVRPSCNECCESLFMEYESSR